MNTFNLNCPACGGEIEIYGSGQWECFKEHCERVKAGLN